MMVRFWFYAVLCLVFLGCGIQPAQHRKTPTEQEKKDPAYWRAVILQHLKENEFQSIIPSPDFPLRTHPDPDTIPALVALLNDEDVGVRLVACKCLGFLGPQAAEAATVVASKLEDRSSGVRHFAAQALAALGSNDRAVLEALGKALKSDDSCLRLFAAEALCNNTKTEEEGLRVLIEFIREGRADRGYEVMYSLDKIAKMGPRGARAIPVLTEMVGEKYSDPYWRASAAHALGRIGTAAQPAVTALYTALAAKNSYLQARSAQALVRILREKTDDTVVNLLDRISRRIDDRDFEKGIAVDSLKELRSFRKK